MVTTSPSYPDEDFEVVGESHLNTVTQPRIHEQNCPVCPALSRIKKRMEKLERERDWSDRHHHQALALIDERDARIAELEMRTLTQLGQAADTDARVAELEAENERLKEYVAELGHPEFGEIAIVLEEKQELESKLARADARIAELEAWRDGACKCERPLRGFIPGMGFRCRLCNNPLGVKRAHDLWESERRVNISHYEVLEKAAREHLCSRPTAKATADLSAALSALHPEEKA